jgi:hypothetical protein
MYCKPHPPTQHCLASMQLPQQPQKQPRAEFEPPTLHMCLLSLVAFLEHLQSASHSISPYGCVDASRLSSR